MTIKQIIQTAREGADSIEVTMVAQLGYEKYPANEQVYRDQITAIRALCDHVERMNALIPRDLPETFRPLSDACGMAADELKRIKENGA